MTRIRTSLILITLLIAAFALSACGSNKPVTHGDNEGIYVNAGPLYYQVQLSRELNPQSVEDREYLADLPAGTTPPAADEEWFGVWMRVENDTDRAHLAASQFAIVDTQGNRYQPIQLPQTNPFAYQAVSVQGKSGNGQPVLPDPDSAAGTGPVQGALLLFKLRTSVYSNRPLDLEITPPEGGTPSSVELDL
jgi:hypothetical protein